jgi:tetratricopeptide (TPR) repeat protein
VERPLTAAEQRSKEVKLRRGPKPERVAVAPQRSTEQWVDEGSLRDAAAAAAERAAVAPPVTSSRRRSTELAPEVVAEVEAAAPAARQSRLRDRLSAAADALDRGRFGDARRMVQPVLREAPDLAFAHELAGLASYRLGEWRKAVAELELARQLDGTLNHHAVLADCYRALRKYTEVDRLWREVRDGSPAPALMAEARIVAAGALADRGDLSAALALMDKAAAMPKKVRDHHLRQWYVLGDLYDRSGDVIRARRFFGLVAQHDADLADVTERLRVLGA